jgi:hypothetical protein
MERGSPRSLSVGLKLQAGSKALCNHPQPNAIPRRMNQILLRPTASLRRLHRRAAEQQLKLFRLTAGRPTQLRAVPGDYADDAAIVRLCRMTEYAESERAHLAWGL